MDDFNVSSLHESKNEWGARLLTILTPLIIEGFKSIFDESYKLCKDNNETEKYLMTFQNFITRIPKWNATIPENIPTEARRTTVSCYSWPGIHPEASMEHYARQLAPFMRVLVSKGYDSLSLDGPFFERALYRGTLKYFLNVHI